MTEEELKAILATGESNTVEFKSDFPKNARGLAKEIAAFGSTEGGRLILGVADDGSITGLALSTEAERKALRERIEGLCAQAISPSLEVAVDHIVVDGKEIAVINVPSGSEDVYYAGGVPYVRVMSVSRPASPQEVREIILLADILQRLKQLETRHSGMAGIAAAIQGQGELATMNRSDLLHIIRKREGGKYPKRPFTIGAFFAPLGCATFKANLRLSAFLR